MCTMSMCRFNMTYLSMAPIAAQQDGDAERVRSLWTREFTRVARATKPEPQQAHKDYGLTFIPWRRGLQCPRQLQKDGEAIQNNHRQTRKRDLDIFNNVDRIQEWQQICSWLHYYYWKENMSWHAWTYVGIRCFTALGSYACELRWQLLFGNPISCTTKHGTMRQAWRYPHRPQVGKNKIQSSSSSDSNSRQDYMGALRTSSCSVRMDSTACRTTPRRRWS